jgi:hypothetical protein
LPARLSIAAGALVLALGALATGCGDDDESGGLAALAPPDAPLFIEGTVRPDDDQREALDSLVGRVAGISNASSYVTAAVDRLFSENGIDATYADDVDPWLGDDAGAFVRSFESDVGSSLTPDFAAMVEVDDADAANEFLQRLVDSDPAPEEEREYDGTEYFVSGADDLAAGVVGERALVVGTEMSLKVAVDASQDESLAESEEYQDRMAELPGDPLGTAFFEPAGLIAAVEEANGFDSEQAKALEPLLGGAFARPIAATLSATPESASVDVAAVTETSAEVSAESVLLDGLPAGAWLAAAVPDLGPTLQRTLDQLSNSGIPGATRLEDEIRAATGLDLGHDVLDWLGDAAVFIEGSAPPAFTAGLIAQTSDPQAPEALLRSVQRLAERDSGLRSSGLPEGAESGFSIGLPGLGGGAEAGVVGDELIAVLGGTVANVLEPNETLAEDERFQAAVDQLGDDLAPMLYVDLGSLLRVAAAGDSDGSPDYEALAPYTEALDSLVVGSRVEDDLALSRVTVTVGGE